MCLPLLFLGRRYRSRSPFSAAGLAILLCVIDELVLDLPITILNLKWNWLGKTLESLWPLLIALIFRLPKKLTGFRPPELPSDYITAILCGLGLTCFHMYYFLQGQFAARDRCDLESILFQFTMPGLGEEVFFRGLLLGVLDKWLGRPWTFLGVKIGYGCFISSGIFVIAHVVDISNDYKISLCPDPFFYFFVGAVAFSMCYLRYRSGSIVPCILAHNLVNGLRYVVSAFAYTMQAH
jgi:membrane protease YdiL (CAAX protease family)